MQTIKDKALKPYYIGRDSHCYTVYEIITPDAEIVENPDKLSPAFIVFDNYKLILKWNRSLRFALAVCNLKNKFENEL